MYDNTHSTSLLHDTFFYILCGRPVGYVYRGELQSKLSYDSQLALGGRVIVTKVVRGSREGETEAKIYPSMGNNFALPSFLARWCFGLLAKRFYQQSSNIVEKA